MFTRRIDAALDALVVCRERLPALREAFHPETSERAALDDLAAALNRARDALAAPRVKAGTETPREPLKYP